MTTGIDLKGMTFSEINQIKTNTLCSPLTCGP